MKKLYLRVLYGVEQMVFNVGDDGVKKHFEPITKKVYAYGSSANVKRNIKELFSELSKIETPKTEFKKKASVKNNTILVNENRKGEQDGVSISIDVKNPICSIFGAWSSDKSEATSKYVKAAIKSCFNVSDMIPVHPLLQNLGKTETGVFVGDRNSIVTLGAKIGSDEVTLKTPEQAAEMVGCSIEDAKKVFGSLRPMNLYEDKQTANGLYQETFSIDIEAFGKVKLSSCTVSESTIKELLDNGWRIVKVHGEDYLSPSREDILKLWEYFVEALIEWDFSSNNSLHGSVKEDLRYSVSMNAKRLNQCTTASVYRNEGGELKAKLSLRNCDEVFNFNTTNLEKWYVCDGSDGNEPIKTHIDADCGVKGLMIQMGKDHII
jgi:hypothetical protein